nr:MAG TPA: hypothetical protein [Caudoviricetes sp.]
MLHFLLLLLLIDYEDYTPLPKHQLLHHDD